MLFLKKILIAKGLSIFHGFYKGMQKIREFLLRIYVQLARGARGKGEKGEKGRVGRLKHVIFESFGEKFCEMFHRRRIDREGWESLENGGERE